MCVYICFVIIYPLCRRPPSACTRAQVNRMHLCAYLIKMYRFFFILYIYVFYVRSYSSIIDILTQDGTDNLLNEPDIIDYETAVERASVKPQTACDNQIIRLTDESVDCSNICIGGGDYTKHAVNYGGNKRRTYCVPKHLHTCHPYTGRIVKDAERWTCMPSYPTVFGGHDADEIIACDGRLFDTVARQTYSKRIPRDLIVLGNPEHETTASGSYRFVCPDRRDHMNNRYVATDVSRLHTIPNKCARALYNDSGRSRPDFATGKCVCAEKYASDDFRDPFCAPEPKDTDTVQQFYERCMNSGAPFDIAVKPCGAATISGTNMSALYRYDILISKTGISDAMAGDLRRPL